MKILVPIMSSKDIDILNPQNYDTEFFLGYTPQWWVDEFNNSAGSISNLSVPINNRNSKTANVLFYEELVEIVKKAEKYQTEVFLVLNAKYYPEYVYDSIGRYIDEVVSAGIKRMIVCDTGMINYLCQHYPDIKVSVSCLNQITNTMAVRFYSSFINVDRIVFPRHMSSEEIEKIATSVSNLEYEYFIFSNKCLYDDGYCRGIHEFTPICKDLFYSDFYLKNGESMGDEKKKLLTDAEHEYADWTRNEILTKNSNFCTANFACSACSILKLIRVKNIVSVKISIRGHDIEERLRQVKMAHRAIQLAEGGADIKEIQKTICSYYGKENLCETGMSCMMV